MILRLDESPCLDPDIVGAKAAWLARGRRAGMPVLPGVVISADESLPTLKAVQGAEISLSEIWRIPVNQRLSGKIQDAVKVLGEPLIVRSSSPLESRAEWSGAFTSYLDIGREQLDIAVRGCWASALSRHARTRYEAVGLSPIATGIAVLVQPMLRPDFGGTARIADGVVSIVAIAGSHAPLLQGWEPGASIGVEANGSVAGEAGVQLMGTEVIRGLATLIRGAEQRTGANSCEWAIAEGKMSLLQLGRAPVKNRRRLRPIARLDSVDATGIARRIRRAPGPLGEALILPWALASDMLLDPQPLNESDQDAGDALKSALHLTAELTSQVWGRREGAQELAQQTLNDLRGPSPSAALSRLRALVAPDAKAAGQAMSLVRRVREGLVQVGAAADLESAWYIPPAIASDMLKGGPVTALNRIGVDQWEPFQAAAALASAQHVPGQAAVSGIGFGRGCLIDRDGAPASFQARDVIVTRYPVPGLGALLWDAAGLVTAGGGPAAHLFQSAQALGVPAVFGVDLDAAFSTRNSAGTGYGVAVDGVEGAIAVVPW